VSSFELLAGLPGEGPAPEQFSATGQGKHREGIVVRFSPGAKQPWVGNFQPSYTKFFSVLPHPGNDLISVIAGGQGYLIDPEGRALVATFGGGIEDAFPLESGDYVFAVGEARHFDDTWHPFSVDVQSGQAKGGAYDGPDI